jgi:VCBS repeat-containing protein
MSEYIEWPKWVDEAIRASMEDGTAHMVNISINGDDIRLWIDGQEITPP